MPRISRESGRGALAPRHGECEMRGSESPLTINTINVSWGDFGGHFSCMKSDMKNFGGDHQTDTGAGHLSPQPHHPSKMALTGDIGSPLFALLQLKLIHVGAILYLLMGPFLEGGVAGAKDDPPLTQCRGEILGDLD